MAAAHETSTLSTLPLPPGALGLPVLGETLEFLRSPSDFSAKREAQHGKIYLTNILGAKTIFMIGAAANHWVFTGEDKYLQNRWTHAVRRLFGPDTMIMLNGEQHRERRRIIMPPFKYESMSHFAPFIEAAGRQHLAQWAQQGGTLNVEEGMRQLAFEVISIFIFGEDAAKLNIKPLSQQFKTWAAGMFTLAINLPFTPFGKALRAKTVLMDTLLPIVKARRATQKGENDVLGTLLAVRDEHGEGLPDETIVHEIELLLFAGHDTTVTSSTNLLLMLAQHPEVWQKAKAEQDALIAESPALTVDNLKKMTYLDAVIHESMRVTPPIGGMFRVMTQDSEFGGYRIPKGYVISLNPRRTHRDESIWTNPEQFDPERWIRGEHKKQPFSQIAFGGGPRLCLGQNFAMVEMKIILSLLLRGYTWSLIADQDLTYRTLPFPLPKSGLQVDFRAL